MNRIIFVVCLASIYGIQVATSQCLNRQPNIIYNRPETPVMYPQPQPSAAYQPISEAQSLATSQAIQSLLNSRLKEIRPFLLNPTTIITDCTPSVCKNLVDIIQLMAVANLIKNKKGGPEIALQVVEPFLKELTISAQSNPFLANQISSVTPPCSNAVLTNTILSNLRNPNVVFPTNFIDPNLISAIVSNIVDSSNFIPGLPISYANGLVGNVNYVR